MQFLRMLVPLSPPVLKVASTQAVCLWFLNGQENPPVWHATIINLQCHDMKTSEAIYQELNITILREKTEWRELVRV